MDKKQVELELSILRGEMQAMKLIGLLQQNMLDPKQKGYWHAFLSGAITSYKEYTDEPGSREELVTGATVQLLEFFRDDMEDEGAND